MTHGTISVGLDVHLQTIVVATMRAGEEVRDHGRIENTPRAIEQLMQRISPDREQLQVVYEAGPTGYVIARQLAGLGIACTVAAPSLIAKKPGDRVKTDRRDARNLARSLSQNAITGVTVPTPALEALRTLSRHREHLVRDLHQVRQRLLKLLHVCGIAEPVRPGTGNRLIRWHGPWLAWLAWLDGLTFPERANQVVCDSLRTRIASLTTELARIEAMLAEELSTSAFQHFYHLVQELRGIGPVTAAGIVTEFGDLRRFTTADGAMAYVGIVPWEDSTGTTIRRGGITRTGNSHLRWLLVEAAWHYTRSPARTLTHPVAIKAATRLHDRYWHHVRKGKRKPVAATAIARELVGFIWGLAQEG